MTETDAGEWDYVIVGSGAGGGTLAARLAEEGMHVFLIEAGSDPDDLDAQACADYDVPAFHPFACENAAMKWDFHVRHYDDEARQARDPKYQPGKGVLYPRAATLGGCTAHNAMIFVQPHDADWNHIAEITGDDSWHASRMRRHVNKLEDCKHRPLWRALRTVGIDPTGHGWDGWLRTEKFLPLDALADDGLLKVFAKTTRSYVRSLATPLFSSARWLRNGGDPNARRWNRSSFEGLCYTPMTTRGRRRAGTRERLREARERCPGRLSIECDALATRVIVEHGVARGVAYLKGPRLYRAHASPSAAAGDLREVRARREVILCGGAFNTPQLLMLSGIGPAAHLREHGIDVLVDLPAVGSNLQDRYEIAVTHRMADSWKVLAGARFAVDDALFARWRDARDGMYASNGAAIAVVRKSDETRHDPDLFLMALLARFEGYRPGFSDAIRAHGDAMTWAVLKAHTENRAGTVRLRSRDPRDTPAIAFRYFEEGSDAAGKDLAAVVDAIRFVRTLTDELRRTGVIAAELEPGPDVKTSAQLAAYVRDTAWGHHASCSCPIGGRDDPGAALDSDFRVRGVRALRVVDASVFPRIPGFFIAAAVYMVAEKAAERILHDATRTAARAA